MDKHLEVMMGALEKAQGKGVFTLNEVNAVIQSYNQIAQFIQKAEQEAEAAKKPSKAKK